MGNDDVVGVVDLVVNLTGVQHRGTMVNWNVCRVLMQGLWDRMRYLLGTIRY